MAVASSCRCASGFEQRENTGRGRSRSVSTERPFALIWGQTGFAWWARTSLAALAIVTTATAVAAGEPGKPAITGQTAQSGGDLDPEQTKVTLDAVDLAIEIFPDREQIAGLATLTFIAKEPVSRLVIDLDPNIAASAISIDGRALPTSAWTNPKGRMTVRLPRAVAAGARVSARIRYGGTPHVAKRPPWNGGFVWDKTKDGKPLVGTAVEGRGCDLIWPCIDWPSYEPRRMDLHITVPAGLKAPSNGRLVSVQSHRDGRTTWNWSARSPNTYAVTLNVGPFEELTSVYRSRYGNSFPLFFWHLPENKEQAPALFAEFAPMLDFFEARIGPYPFGDEKTRFASTADYRRIGDQVTGGRYGWFFDVYLDQAALPDLVPTRRGNRLTLAWKAPNGRPFPMPVELEVDDKPIRLAMRDGRETLTIPATGHVVIDPMARILRRSIAIEETQAQKDAEANKGK